MSRIEACLPMIEKVISYRFAPFARENSFLCKVHGIEYGDLYGIGAVGLMKADHTYDAAKGAKFETHAFRCIYSEIRHFLRDNEYCGTYPRDVKEVADRVAKYDDLSPERIVEITGVDRDFALDVYEYLHRKKCSLDMQVPHQRAAMQEVVTYRDLLPDRINVEYQVLRKMEFEDKIGLLTGLSRHIMLLSLSGVTQVEIAKRTGYSQSRISRIIRHAVDMMNEAYP